MGDCSKVVTSDGKRRECSQNKGEKIKYERKKYLCKRKSTLKEGSFAQFPSFKRSIQSGGELGHDSSGRASPGQLSHTEEEWGGQGYPKRLPGGVDI